MLVRLLAAAALAASAGFAPALAGEKAEKNARAEKGDIVDVAASTGSFNTLIAAVRAAGLEETLRGEGPFTVFAPTDEAFAALPPGTLDGLLKPENKQQLVDILTYHVAPGKTKSKDLAGKRLDVATVNGATLAIDATDGVKVNGANVVKADVYADNGVIHVIDSVLMPPADQ
ncbi:fasciclin domain-containing protein [Amphiplicatus metriothermophilus]|uniref:Uncaracterized surface protein containing fasciclin (FAS1) repeats n=1 Tax=Amphiplicatus metriothermophilus TaxID=1519374 RepID=A0A239PQQ5_9PROT|nr:fasciclin domain-containing protein [Amphiplicatus metriothermophilus]MBB5518788.1 putative surface protein with fasciclin (FAS1) repeats [Amphiplicatus metriothermophilus]SNT72057.1 Uncaracterized surface protein containing fasciclin (FAS1) repeats [Amphiplicatus metriothermophilus]